MNAHVLALGALLHRAPTPFVARRAAVRACTTIEEVLVTSGGEAGGLRARGGGRREAARARRRDRCASGGGRREAASRRGDCARAEAGGLAPARRRDPRERFLVDVVRQLDDRWIEAPSQVVELLFHLQRLVLSEGEGGGRLTGGEKRPVLAQHLQLELGRPPRAGRTDT